jgi:oxygen-independent coproporphyrinogen-3 oxidase
MIGLGVSSISDSWYGFAQNEKTLEDYYTRLDNNEIPVFKGHILTDEDLIIRKHILNLMCHLKTDWSSGLYFEKLPEVLFSLEEMLHDELIEITDTSLKITEKGKPFVRNVCMAFDLRLRENQPQRQLFSMTI